MYGLVNKAVQYFVIDTQGEETWNSIKEKAGIKEDAFVSMEAYPDNITYDIVGAASELLGADANDILESFGVYWIDFAMAEGYDHLIDLAGGTFPEFLKNLNAMHIHIAQSFTNLKPPSFICDELSDNTFRLIYTSERPGLAMFVKGLLIGLGKRFNVGLKIDYNGNLPDSEHDHEFIVEYTQ